MATLAKDIRISPEEYLKGEQESDVRHEFANGYTYAMVGASRIHNRLSLSLSSMLHQHLLGSSCRTYVSDMKVRIRTQDLDLFYYPDIMVSCDPNPPSEYFEDKPKLLVEVLSDSTESKDRLEKLNAYTRLEALQEYVLIAQRKVAVEVYRRAGESWTLETLKDGDSLQLESVGLTVPVKAIYEPVLGMIG